MSSLYAQNDGWSALRYGTSFIFFSHQSRNDFLLPPAAVNDAVLAAEVLVQYDINLKARTESTNEMALGMAE